MCVYKTCSFIDYAVCSCTVYCRSPKRSLSAEKSSVEHRHMEAKPLVNTYYF